MVWARWRRTTVGTSCRFCLMLASRGAVYTSEDVAKYGYAGSRYHDHCDCGVELETNPGDKTAVRIDPVDANRILHVRSKGRGYTYDLSKYRNLGVTDPPKAKRIARVTRDAMDELRQRADEVGARASNADSWTAKDVPRWNPKGTIQTGNQLIPDDASLALLDDIVDVGRRVDDEVQRRLAERLAAGKVSVKVPAAVQDAAEKAAKKRAAAQRKYDALVDEAMSRDEARYFADKHGMTDVTSATFKARAGRSLTDAELDELQKYLSRYQWDTNVYKAKKALLRAITADEKADKAVAKAMDVDISPGSPQWAQAMREAIMSVLDELHPGGLGGDRAAWVQKGARTWRDEVRDQAKVLGTRSELRQAMDFAADGFPQSWNELVSRLANGRIAIGSTSRGYNRDGVEIALSKHDATAVLPSDVAGLLRVAVHEYGHSMEKAIPGLTQSEWAFLCRRAARGSSLPDGVPGGTSTIYRGEYGWKDDFSNHYSGKVYRQSPGSSYEVFTTGVEALLGGQWKSYMRTAAGDGDDIEFRRFILGVLGVLGR